MGFCDWGGVHALGRFVCVARRTPQHRLARRPSVRKAYGACHAALSTAVALCERHSLQAAAEAAHELWFSVLEVVVYALRDVRQRHPCTEAAAVAGSSRPTTPLDLESVEARAGVLQQLLTSLMEEAIRAMAGCVWRMSTWCCGCLVNARCDGYGSLFASWLSAQVCAP